MPPSPASTSGGDVGRRWGEEGPVAAAIRVFPLTSPGEGDSGAGFAIYQLAMYVLFQLVNSPCRRGGSSYYCTSELLHHTYKETTD
jgi:hypothetical protein